MAAEVRISRRTLLGGVVAATVGIGAAGTRLVSSSPASTTNPGRHLAALPTDPFTLGVASGDPTHHGVVLWTRLAPAPTDGGGMPGVPVDVEWEVATDERFAHVVRRGVRTARPASAHSVHADVNGLAPGRWYWYRFRAGAHVSPAGRTRTAPPPGRRDDRLRFAFASCQDYEAGFYPAWRHVADEDLDVVVFLGDYICERAPDPAALRTHLTPAPDDLASYRDRWASYKLDQPLQAAHAAAPWIATWDDHEVQNNYAGDISNTGEPAAPFLERRAAAYRAWWEHTPVRLDPPTTADEQIYRRLRWGAAASFHVLDTRQYRSEQPCDAGSLDVGAQCDEAFAESQTMTGSAQEAWLLDGLATSTARWDVVCNQTIMTKMALPAGLFNLDQWDGYVAQRTRLLDALGAPGAPRNTVVITGDIHASGVADLLTDFDDPSSVVASELVTTSITSSFPAQFVPLVEAVPLANPWVRYAEARHHGYVVCEVDADRLRADYRFVADVASEHAPVTTASSWVVEDRRRGVVPASTRDDADT